MLYASVIVKMLCRCAADSDCGLGFFRAREDWIRIGIFEISGYKNILKLISGLWCIKMADPDCDVLNSQSANMLLFCI